MTQNRWSVKHVRHSGNSSPKWQAGHAGNGRQATWWRSGAERKDLGGQHPRYPFHTATSHLTISYCIVSMDTRVNSGLDKVLSCLSDNGYTISSLISNVLLRCHTLEDQRVQSAREGLERDAMDICTRLCGHIPSSASVTQWALQTAQSMLRSEIEELTTRSHGLHFDAKAATAEQIESMFMPRLAAKMRQVAHLFGA